VCLLVSLLAAAAGNLCADPTSFACIWSGTNGLPLPGVATNTTTDCLNSPTSFLTASALDSLDWGAPKALSGPSGLGDATPGANNYQATTYDPVSYRTATVRNDQIAIQLAPGYTGSAPGVTRVDDFALRWNGSTWLPGNFVTPSLVGAQLHFNSASDTTSPPGDHLLELKDGGPLELTLLGKGAFGEWFRIAALGGDPTGLFVAVVEGFDIYGHSLGKYTMTESGSSGTGGICAGLSNTPPVPCNDAPLVGFYDPEGRIKSIYISVFNPSNLNSPIGFAIDTLTLQEVPEPVMPLMIGGGLAAIALYRRKRRSPVV